MVYRIVKSSLQWRYLKWVNTPAAGTIAPDGNRIRLLGLESPILCNVIGVLIQVDWFVVPVAEVNVIITVAIDSCRYCYLIGWNATGSCIPCFCIIDRCCREIDGVSIDVPICCKVPLLMPNTSQSFHRCQVLRYCCCYRILAFAWLLLPAASVGSGFTVAVTAVLVAETQPVVIISCFCIIDRCCRRVSLVLQFVSTAIKSTSAGIIPICTVASG